MSPLAESCRIASHPSQSTTRRCPSGSGILRRSGRGGKSPAGPPTPGSLVPLLPLPPHQEAGGQHYTDRMPMEPRPQPARVLIPAQQPLGLLVVLLHPVPPVRVLNHRCQRRVRPEVAPVILLLPGLTTSRPLPDQPAEPAPAPRRHPPAAHRREPAPQPAGAPLTPAHGPPGRTRPAGQQRFGPLRRGGAGRRQGEVSVDGHHLTLSAPLQAGQEVGIVAGVGVGGHAGVPHAPGPGLVQQPQGDLRLGPEGDLRGPLGLLATVDVVGPLLRQVQPGGDGPGERPLGIGGS